jgi:hypothetical protein
MFMAALVVITLLGVAACTSPTSNKTTTSAASLSSWQIKGSTDGWSLHQLTIDQLTSTKLTYTMATPYAVNYQFVLVGPTTAGALGADPAQKFDFNVSAASANVTNNTAFVMQNTATAGFGNNVAFTATATTYTVTVDITNPAAPSVTLVPGTTAAAVVTNAVLLAQLQLKGNEFSQINGATVAAWTAADGTVSGGTISWDVLVDNKLGSFGFNSLDGWLSGPQVVSPTVAGTSATVANAVSNGSANAAITSPPKSGSVYTISITPDVTSTSTTARYPMTITLKTLSTTNWAFAAWTSTYLVGSGAEFGTWTPTTGVAMTNASGVFTKQITATGTAEQFQLIPTAVDWTGQLGFAAIVADATGLALTNSGGNIAFTAAIGTTYTITVDFTTAAYIANGTPTVKVVTP